MSFEKARDACYKKNCAAITKRKAKIDKKTRKLKKKRCAKYDTETSSMEDFFNCAQKVEKESGYTQWFKDTVKCNKKYCAKEQEDFLNAISAKLKSSKKGGAKNTTQKLQDKLLACKKKECKAAYSLKEKEEKLYEKIKKTQCKKNDYDCADNLYANSAYKKAYVKLNACTGKVCENEKKAYNEAFNKEYDAQFSKDEQADRMFKADELIKKARKKLEK
jgi:hypothetical protein